LFGGNDHLGVGTFFLDTYIYIRYNRNHMNFTEAQVTKIFSNLPYTSRRDWARLGFYQYVSAGEDARGERREYRLLHLLQIGLAEILVRKLKARADNIRTLMASLFYTNGKDETEILEKFDHFLLIAERDTLWAGSMTKVEIKTDELLNPIYLNTVTTVINLGLLKKTINNAIRQL